MKEKTSYMLARERGSMVSKNLSSLLESGYALITRDFMQAHRELGAQASTYQEERILRNQFSYFIAARKNIRVTKYKGDRIITDNRMDLEETDIEEVKKRIDIHKKQTVQARWSVQ